ncbi:MAG: hypothetical protein ACK2UR_16205, partial [Candidatus Promineifilaceae bacterium]
MSDEKVNENEFNVEDAVEGEELSTDAADRAADVVDGEFIEAESAEGEVTAGEPSLEDQLQEARDEAAKNLDSYLRAQAELA